MRIHTICWTIAGALAACSPSPPPPQRPATIDAEPTATERTAMPQAQCEAQGGTVVGDIGDGATHRPDYVCPSGKPPLGAIAPPEGGPIAVEGSVCCPR